MQPLDPEKAPKVHIPALNHVGFWVDNLEKAVEHLTAKGVKFTPGGIRKGACKFFVYYLYLYIHFILIFYSLIQLDIMSVSFTQRALLVF